MKFGDQGTSRMPFIQGHVWQHGWREELDGGGGVEISGALEGRKCHL